MAERLPGTPPVIPGFQYVRPLGTGGFADVFLFEQNRPRRWVAVKVLLRDVVSDEVLAMFNTEADTLGSLSMHPSILTIHQAGISSDGRPFLVTEYCPSSYTTRYRDEIIPVSEVLDLGVRVGTAVESSHRSGMLHRDIKPANLLINEMGSPVLSDFGIAMTKDNSAGATAAMSLPWSAPEVISGNVTGSVAADVWSLGATVYAMLANRSPFEIDQRGQNTSEKLAARIAKAQYQPIRRADVPQELENVLRKALAKQPADRYPTAAAFAEDVQRVQLHMGLPLAPLEYSSTSALRYGAPTAPANRGDVRSSVPWESQRRATTSSTSRNFRIEEPAPSGVSAKALVIAIAGTAVVVVALTLGFVFLLGGGS